MSPARGNIFSLELGTEALTRAGMRATASVYASCFGHRVCFSGSYNFAEIMDQVRNKYAALHILPYIAPPQPTVAHSTMGTIDVNSSSLSVSRIVSRAASNDTSTMITVQLSPDGNYFAVGFRSGLLEVKFISMLFIYSLTVHEVHDTFHFRIYRQISLGDTIVTTLAWHPTFPRTLVAGTKNGNLHFFKFGGDPVCSSYAITS